ncbi:MAG: S8 family serine peptidase [Steroidobacteraceae bacterium]
MKHRALLFVALAAGGATLAVMSPAHSEPPAKRFLIEFVDGRAASGKAAVRAAGGTIVKNLDRHNAVSAEIAEAKLGALRNNPNVKLVEEDALRYPVSMVHSLPSGADRGAVEAGSGGPEVVPYGIAMVQAEGFRGDTASGVKVCVIDSGYDLGHEDKPGADVVTGTDDIGGSGPWTEDGSGHGTHVSGTINALDNDIGVIGVFPSVPMHIVRVFGNDGIWAYSSDLIGALDDCMDHGANVINMSLSGILPSVLENAAFLHALKSGVLSIAAAGNGGAGRSCDMFADPSRPERQSCRMHYPSGYDSVVAVAAVDSDANVASFSQVNSKVELAAPGVSVLSTVPTGSMMDVTLEAGGSTMDVVPMDNFEIPAAPVVGALQDCGLGAQASDCGNATGKICLIERGAVTFATKALACQDAGGVAAVVFQSETGGSGPVLGTLGTTFVDIPVVGLDRATGLDLRANHLGTSATLAFTLSGYDYDRFDGTSMATPHVAGVAALIWSRHPECGPQEIRAAMNATALDRGTPGRDKYYGFGIVQAQDADEYLKTNGCTGN